MGLALEKKITVLKALKFRFGLHPPVFLGTMFLPQVWSWTIAAAVVLIGRGSLLLTLLALEREKLTVEKGRLQQQPRMDWGDEANWRLELQWKESYTRGLVHCCFFSWKLPSTSTKKNNSAGHRTYIWHGRYMVPPVMLCAAHSLARTVDNIEVIAVSWLSLSRGRRGVNRLLLGHLARVGGRVMRQPARSEGIHCCQRTSQPTRTVYVQ